MTMSYMLKLHTQYNWKTYEKLRAIRYRIGTTRLLDEELGHVVLLFQSICLRTTSLNICD